MSREVWSRTVRLRYQARVWLRAIVICFGVVAAARAGERAGNWTGDYPPCDRHKDLLVRGAMTLGVRFTTSNDALAAAFTRALDYWATILDMDWHREDTRNCAIQIVDGDSRLFKPGEAARAQFPDRPAFQGWIAFDLRRRLTQDELFPIAVHELGHLMGLAHSPNASSVMYFLCLDGPVLLDDADLAALAARHKLRTKASASRAFHRLQHLKTPDRY